MWGTEEPRATIVDSPRQQRLKRTIDPVEVF
jgi:hypothetical protein